MKMTPRTLALIAAAGAVLYAQPPVAPTPESVGPIRGDEVRGYNVTNSVELGFRVHGVNGNEAAYRSDVNYGNGLRLLGSSLTINSKDGHGRLFDEVLLNTQGLGNDPYQFATFRLRHNRWYRYDLNWRISRYANPGLTLSPGTHLLDTSRMWQDHDLTLLPESRIQFLMGYSRNSQEGAGLYTQNLFDQHRGDEFPLFANINRRQREFRLGGQLQYRKLKLILLRGWQRYQEDAPLSLANGAGLNAGDSTALTSFSTANAYSGATPFWRAHLLGESGRWLALSARFTYAGSRRGFAIDESATGTSRLGAAANRQFFAGGSGTRPVTTANFTVSLFPAESVTLTNHTAFHNVRMDGNATLTQVQNGFGSAAIVDFRSLGISSFINASNALFRPTRWLGFRAGYQISRRRIRSVEAETIGAFNDRLFHEQTNRVHAGLLGVRLQPFKPLTFNFDLELGRANRPFLTLSERNYHAFGARGQYKRGSLLLSAALRTNYNANSVSLFSHSSRSRNYALDASWSARRFVSFDAGYGKQHLDTLTGIAYFASGELAGPQSALYVSNVHSGHATVRFALASRADFSLGYMRVQDTGDGRAQLAAGAGAFPSAQVLPLTFDSPQARVSIRLHSRLRLNFGYQYYRYAEEFSALRGYRAHTGFSSMLWSF